MDTATGDSGEPNVEATPDPNPDSEAPKSEDPFQQTSLPIDSLITSGYKYVQFALSTYGWHILLVVILSIIVWSYVKPYFLRWMKKMQEREEKRNYDPVKAEHFQDSMLRAREKMQRELDTKAAEHQDKMEKRKEEERDERIKQWEEFKVVSKTTKPKPKMDYQQRSRRDYFPLDGTGGGGGYRAARRSFGGGGG